MLAFLKALYRRSTGEPVHLIFDEADLRAPEHGGQVQRSCMRPLIKNGRRATRPMSLMSV